MLETLLLHDDAMIDHDPGRGHPERPDRLRAIMEKLQPEGGHEPIPALHVRVRGGELIAQLAILFLQVPNPLL